MAYDEVLSDRIRDLIIGTADITEQKMFGGLVFLVNGHMAVAASGQGGLLARVDPEESDDLIDDRDVVPMEMRGRPMRGWLRVSADLVADDDRLQQWVDRSVTYASSLPRQFPGSRSRDSA